MLNKMMSNRNLMRRCAMALLLLLPAFAHAQAPAGEAEAELLFREVRVLDTARGTLGAPTDVLVRGNRIAAIVSSSLTVSTSTACLRRIDRLTSPTRARGRPIGKAPGGSER